jgi:iron only hydrogenase large subunit-like protein
METQNKEIESLYEAIKNHENLVGMLAPSFPIDFSYPEILQKLKKVGFSNFIEVAVGAIATNAQIQTLLEKNSSARYITSPCPTMVRMIKNKYPHLVKYLSPIDSPMIASAKIVRNRFPNARPVFIGPCIVKKLEASEDFPELNIIVLTYKEIKEILTKVNGDQNKNDTVDFDLTADNTRLYSLSGGLAHSAGLQKVFTDEQINIVSGIQNIEKALNEFENDTKIRFLDILFCDGGCVNGPGIISSESLDQRRQKIVRYWTKGEESNLNG